MAGRRIYLQLLSWAVGFFRSFTHKRRQRFLTALNNRKSILILTISYILSRIFLYKKIPFDASTIGHYMQYLDPAILRNDLINGLVYLHMQPPLFNLFLGVVLKISPAGYESYVFAGIYFVMGMIIIVSIFILMRYLKISNTLALFLSLLFIFFPSLIMAERWLFYAYPIAAMLVLSAVFLYKFAATGRRVHMVIFLILATCVVMTRSFFDLFFWFVPVLFILGVLIRSNNRGERWPLAWVCLFFFLLAGSVSMKNYLMFGTFGSSSWRGMNLSAMTSFVKKSDIQNLVSSGEVTPLALTTRFSAPRVYYKYYKRKPSTGIKVLDDFRKTTGAINRNNVIYTIASKEYQRNTFVIIKNYPKDFFKAVLNQTYIFFGFTPYRFFWNHYLWQEDDSTERVPQPRFFPQPKWGKIRTGSTKDTLKDLFSFYVLPAVFLLIFIMVVVILVFDLKKKLKNRSENRDDMATATLEVFLLFNILYVFFISAVGELGEGCFFRIPIDPFIVVGLGIACQKTIEKIGRKTQRRA